MEKVGQTFRGKLVEHLKKGVDANKNIFMLRYEGISSSEIGDFRKSLKASGAQMYVSKNSIAQKALQELEHDKLAERIGGQTAFIWSNADAVAVSKLLIKFIKGREGVTVPAGILEGKILEQEEIKRLSELPSREVLLSMLLSTIQSPLTRLAGALNAKTREVLSILKQLSERSK